MEIYTKEQLIQYATFCRDETLQANHGLLIVKQIREMGKKYKAELNISPAFYTTVSNSLISSTILNLSRLYDTDSSSIQINSLMAQIKQNIDIFPEVQILSTPDGADTFEIPLHPQKKFQELANRKRKLHDTIENLRNVRNRIYAHNDATILENRETVFTDYPIVYEDIEKLITFSFDTCDFVIMRMTGVCRKREAININDLEGSLIYVRLGMKYKDVEVNRNVLEFQKNLNETWV